MLWVDIVVTSGKFRFGKNDGKIIPLSSRTLGWQSGPNQGL